MKIDKQTLKIWKKELEPSDYLKIYKEHNVAPKTVKSALKKGTCQQGTYDKITHFLSMKKFRKDTFINQFEND